VFQNESTSASLEKEKKRLETTTAQMPKDKIVPKVQYGQGETIQIVQRELVNDAIELAQNVHGNTLIYLKPLPKPAPPPVQAPTAEDPNAVPQVRLSDLIEEAPYEISLRGNYSSINGFINDLNKSKEIVEISNVEIIPERKGRRNMDPMKPLEVQVKLNYIIQKT
jgi:hypothetical protein